MYTVDFIDFLEYVFSMKSSKDKVIAICLMAGMTQREIGEMANCSHQYVSKRLKVIRKGCKNMELFRYNYDR